MSPLQFGRRCAKCLAWGTDFDRKREWERGIMEILSTSLAFRVLSFFLGGGAEEGLFAQRCVGGFSIKDLWGLGNTKMAEPRGA